MICKCGTVSDDGECTCTATGADDEREAEPYLDMLLINFFAIAKRERKIGNHEIANVISTCIEEINLLRSRLRPAAAAEAPTSAEGVIPNLPHHDDVPPETER
jgi:hypothetical protein